jgi:Zinc finger, C2H2 type
MARARTKTSTTGEFKCPECGRTFARAAALGAHRRQAHGVVGAATRSRSSRPRPARTTPAAKSSTPSTATPRRRPNRPASNSSRARTSRDRSVDRDALLQALFPNGIPAKEDVIRAVNSWLDDAEQLAKMT